MKQPWEIRAGGEVVLVKPDTWLFPAGAWDDVEEALGTTLPNDYKELIGDGFACIFDEELLISSPFDPDPGLNLLVTAAAIAFSLAYVKAAYPEAYPYQIYPEPGGLLGWGMDGGGGQYHWAAAAPDPDTWTVAVSGRPVFDPQVQDQGRGLTSFLSGLASGEIRVAALSDWPTPNAAIKRRESS